MPVFDLKNIAHEWICCQRVRKVLLSLLEWLQLIAPLGGRAKIFSEVVPEIAVSIHHLRHCFFDVVYSHAVFAKFNKTAVIWSCQDLIRFQPKICLFLPENRVHKRYQLHCKLLEPEIVARLDDDACQFPGLKMSKPRVGPNTSLLITSKLFKQEVGLVA